MWTTPDIEIIERRLLDRETAVLDKVVPDWRDRAAAALADAVAEVRSAFAACPRNTMGPEGTVPECSLRALGALLLCDVLSDLPKGGPLTDKREDLQRDARTFLNDAAACRRLAEPEGGHKAAPGFSVVNDTPAQTARQDMAGL